MKRNNTMRIKQKGSTCKTSKSFILLFGAMLLTRCSICTKIDITGTYSTKHSFDTIVLNEDSSFLYLAPRWGVIQWEPTLSRSRDGIIVIDSILGNYKVIGRNKYFIAKPSTSFYINEHCDTCQFTTIRVFDEKTKEPLEYAVIELHEGPFIVDELYTDNKGCATINNRNCDSLLIKFIEHNTISVANPKNNSNIDVYMTQKHDWWIEKWIVLTKNRIKQDGYYGEVFIKSNASRK